MIRVQKFVLDLYAHRAPPFDQVVSAVQPERNPSYTPLFQVMLNWRGGDQHALANWSAGLEVDSVLAESRTAKFDLTLMLTDGAETSIWKSNTAPTFLTTPASNAWSGISTRCWRRQPPIRTQRLSELPLLTDAERRQLLVEWNRTEVPYPKDRCLHQLV